MKKFFTAVFDIAPFVIVIPMCIFFFTELHIPRPACGNVAIAALDMQPITQDQIRGAYELVKQKNAVHYSNVISFTDATPQGTGRWNQDSARFEICYKGHWYPLITGVDTLGNPIKVWLNRQMTPDEHKRWAAQRTRDSIWLHPTTFYIFHDSAFISPYVRSTR